ncbi:MAG: hypothetical protein ILM98_11765 [Kiritimatiellae bacterium]|nr:hypothetical protein [Kiritimatiellia bacterium]
MSIAIDCNRLQSTAIDMRKSLFAIAFAAVLLGGPRFVAATPGFFHFERIDGHD